MGDVKARVEAKQRARMLQTCVHFNGLFDFTTNDPKRCQAGVAYDDVKDSDPPRWPCVPPLGGRPPCTTTCEHRRLPTPEEQGRGVARHVDG